MALAMLGRCPEAAAQEAVPPGTRAAQIAAQQADKARDLHPYSPGRAERIVKTIEEQFISGQFHWHPYLQSAYPGGGFTLGGGYLSRPSPYSRLDLRASLTLSGYKRVEGEFVAPRFFGRQGSLSLLGGWREATQVGFYGTGTHGTSADNRTNYGFRQPYISAAAEVRPARGPIVLGGGLEYSQWQQRPGKGRPPSVEQQYTGDELHGLGASPTYLLSHATAALDWRPGAGYARRGGRYEVGLRDHRDQHGRYSFRQVDYQAVQHIPVLRDAWVLSLRGKVETTYTGEGQQVPFFLLPTLGGGSTLRGFANLRFRDRHSLLLSAEWRVLVSPFIDTALFVDAGKVTADRSHLNLSGLKRNYGVGIRLHGPTSTPLRIDVAKSGEGLFVVFGSSAAF